MQTKEFFHDPPHPVAHCCIPRFFTYSDGKPSDAAPVVCGEQDEVGRL